MLNKSTVKKASKTVIECELRAAWAEAEIDIRHTGGTSKRIGDYIAMLTKESATRG